jgi:isopenicillin-N epimerase
MLAPVGTGFLYVRRENIAKVWPLTPAAASKSDNIRKFEEIGTHPAANHNAIAEALAFHQAIGTERKAARLRYLNERWATRVEKLPGVKILNSREANQAWGLFNVSLERVESPKAYEFLWSKYRIITAAIKRDDYQGLRVTPNVYTTLEEVDTFAMAIEDLLKNGPPSTAA